MAAPRMAEREVGTNASTVPPLPILCPSVTCKERALRWEGLPTRPCSLRFLNFLKYS